MKATLDTLLDFLFCAIVVALIVALGGLLCSCTLQVDPDGTRHWSVSGSEIARGIIIYADK